MKWRDLLAEWGLNSLKINTGIVEAVWEPKDQDRIAAWEMYVELLTCITTQPLSDTSGDEKTALDSIHSLFPTTREILRRNGPGCIEFSKIAIVVLNQIVRPFTAKWHPVVLKDGFKDEKVVGVFRDELKVLQVMLQKYTGLLSELADVEDLTILDKQIRTNRIINIMKWCVYLRKQFCLWSLRYC